MVNHTHDFIQQQMKERAIALEHFETPEWAIAAILQKEMLTHWVIDPCAGTGIIGDHVRGVGSHTIEIDLHDWGCDTLDHVRDFFAEPTPQIEGNTVMMNPPFSKAQEFVEAALQQGARKVICFQRFAWYESRRRKEFWDKHPPQRIYICGDRATCWRHDIPEKERTSGTATAHAWFVWEHNQPAGTMLGRIYKENGE